MNLAGKVAIVTGASSGIGEATARLLAQKGGRVALVARSREKLEQLSKELPDSFVVVADMSIPGEVRKMVREVARHYGRIDVLVNSAGQGYDARIENINIERFHKIFDVDVVGPLVAMQAVIPLMKKHGGSIVNISSGTALMVLPNMGAYSSLKRAIALISLTAREELKGDNIVVSVVYPYITDTDFEKNTLKDGEFEWGDAGDSHELPPGDSASYVAGKILEGIETGKAEIYAHDWMGKDEDS
jgi:short-subunit dehydrogenase